MQPIAELPPRPTYPAGIISVVFHTLLFTILGLLYCPEPQGTAETSDRKVGIALVKSLPERVMTEPLPERETVEPDQASDPANQPQKVPVSDHSGMGPLSDSGEPPPLDLAGLFASTTATPEPTAAGPTNDASGIGATSGQAKGIGGLGKSGSKVTAELFGVKGYAHRFVFVIDRSDSMNEHRGRPFAAAKRELLKAIKNITPKEEFQIIFYSDRAQPVRRSGQPVEILTGERPTMTMAEQMIQVMVAGGGTNHLDALKMALRMRPDVIFFLTDGRTPGMTGYQLQDITNWARSQDTVIHCIEFGTDLTTPEESFLIDMAKQTEGDYRYFNVGGL